MRPHLRARPLLVAGLAALALAPAIPAAEASAQPRVLIVFASTGVLPPSTPTAATQGVDLLLRAFDRQPELATGLLSLTQGAYSQEQALLDVSQGSRVSQTAFTPRAPGPLRLITSAGGGGQIAGWRAAVKRAKSAPASIHPGQLAAHVPEGAGYAGVGGRDNAAAVSAADRSGHIAAVSLGPAGALVGRLAGLLRAHRLVVATLPSQDTEADLSALLRSRPADELVIVTEQPPRGPLLQLVPVAVAGAGTAGRGLTSETTRRDGVIAGVDILPTTLHWLGVKVPDGVTGARIRKADRVGPHSLLKLRERYSHIAPRRIRTLEVLLAAWALLALAFAPFGRLRAALRIGGLGFLWVPTVVLVPGVIDPARGLTETLMVTLGAFALGAITDAVVSWPRAPVVPAAVCLAVYLADLVTGSNLITLSLLGPNPRAGARFYGIGNELEPALPILLFVGLAALMTGRERSRRIAAVFAGSGLVLAMIVGSGLLGADVGGVITVSVGTAVATLVMLPGRISRKTAAALFVVVPVIAVGALAVLDLVTGANSHFSRTVLQANGGESLRDIFVRRYDFAYHSLTRGKMPFATSLAAIGAVVGVVMRDRLYAPLPDPAWRAALLGGLAAGIAGALSNDSGPLLFIVAVFVLGVITAYIQGRPDTVDGLANLDGGAPGLAAPDGARSASRDPGVTAGVTTRGNS